jgi:ATP-dependent DNA helicase DinG
MTLMPPDLAVQVEEGATLDPEAVLAILSDNGPLSQILSRYESRAQQKKMMAAIIDAFNQDHVALIEAGTGTGKSLAYLIPAILWARKTGQRTVISTHTINLQEQLLFKDIPLISKALKIDLKAVLVKGMGNYVCLRKLDDLHQEWLTLTPQEAEEVKKIEAWSHSTTDGTRSSLSFLPSSVTWDKVSAEYDTCTRKECPHFKECFFIKARRQAHDATLLIANHHLLFSDLVKKNDSADETMILPPYTRVILDEAHNIEDIATDFFANRASYLGLLQTLSRLSTEKQGKAAGKLPLLKHLIQICWRRELPPSAKILMSRLTIDLPGLRNDFLTHANQAFEAFGDFARRLIAHSKPSSPEDSASPDSKLRLLPLHQTHPLWSNTLLPFTERLIESGAKYVQALLHLEKEASAIEQERFTEMAKGILNDINAYTMRLDSSLQVLKKFINLQDGMDRVRWIEHQTLPNAQNTHLIDADLDIGKSMAGYLFNRFPTVILCSATLTTSQKFDYFRSRLGLTSELLKERVVQEHIYDSPFNYQQQALLAVPTDLPSPQSPEFTAKAAECIWECIQTSHGNAFVLFTSYQMLKACYDLLAERMKQQRFHALKQGDCHRQALLNKFKETDRSVLFGTDSF